MQLKVKEGFREEAREEKEEVTTTSTTIKLIWRKTRMDQMTTHKGEAKEILEEGVEVSTTLTKV